MKNANIFICIILVPIIFRISPSLSESIELRELTVLSISNCSDLKALENNIQSWENLSKDAMNLQNPNIYFGLGPSRQNGEGGARGELGIKQPLPLWGKREINADINKNHKNLEEIDLKKLRLEKEALVIKASYKLVELRHELEHFEKRERRFQVLTTHLNNYPFPSPDKSLEKTLIANKLSIISNKKIPIKSNIENFNSLLSTLTNITGEIDPKVKWISKFKTHPSYSSTKETVINHNPLIAFSRLQNKLAKLNEKQARTKYLPDLSIGTTLGYEQSNGEQKLALLTFDSTLPFLNSGKDQISATTEIVNSKTNQENANIKLVEQEFDRLWNLNNSAKKRITNYPLKMDDECDIKLNEAKENLKKSLISVSNFIELDSQCFDLHNEVYESQLDYIISLIDIFLLKGQSPLEIQELS